MTHSVTWSEQVYTIFGRDPALGPMPLEEVPRHLVPEDLPVLAAALERLLGEGAAIDQPFRITTADGVRHLRIVAEAQKDVDGAPVEVHGFFQDLTAQRDAELALRESERAVLVERGMLQAERALAARLQDALLPIPEQSLELAGLCIDVAYVPSESGVNVGGDWYSAIELPDKSALFVVGDVAGHGLDAVATMAQLRFTTKGMTVTGSALPDVLSRLNTLLLHTASDNHGATATATVIMGIYRPWDRRLTWVRAGHLPPLLIRDGAASFLPLPAGSLLGATFDSVYEQDSLDLQPGDHLVLYTDGLVEEPGRTSTWGSPGSPRPPGGCWRTAGTKCSPERWPRGARVTGTTSAPWTSTSPTRRYGSPSLDGAGLRFADEAGHVVGDRVEDVRRGRVVAQYEEAQGQPVGHGRQVAGQRGDGHPRVEAHARAELLEEFGVGVGVQLVLPPGQVLEAGLTQGVLGELVREHVLAGVGGDVVPVRLEAGPDGLPEGGLRLDRLLHHRDVVIGDRGDDRLQQGLLGLEAVVEDAQ